MTDSNAPWRRRLASCGCALAIAVLLNACSSESATRNDKTSKLDCSSQVAAGGDSGATDAQGSNQGGEGNGDAGSSSASQSASGKAGSTPSSPVEDVPTPASNSATSSTSRGAATDDCGNYKTGNDSGSGAEGGVNG